MIQFKWVEKEEEKDFTACTSANDFLLWKQKFCTQSQLCRRHRIERMVDAGFQLIQMIFVSKTKGSAYQSFSLYTTKMPKF